MTENQFSINGRMWIETPEGKLLGPGRTELLERIHASGSIRQAALQMKMSYKQAWDIINQLNDQFKQPLVISHRGGKGGGKAEVTDYGMEIIRIYRELQSRFKAFISRESESLSL